MPSSAVSILSCPEVQIHAQKARLNNKMKPLKMNNVKRQNEKWTVHSHFGNPQNVFCRNYHVVAKPKNSEFDCSTSIKQHEKQKNHLAAAPFNVSMQHTRATGQTSRQHIPAEITVQAS